LKGKQQHQRGQQGSDRPGADLGQGGIKSSLAALEQGLAQHLGQQHRDHDVQHHGSHQRVPGHDDGRQAQQQGHDGCERKHHDAVVQGHLRQREQRIAASQAAPHEHHGRARGRSQQDQAGDVAVDLLGGQVRCKQVPHEEPAQQRHREGLDRPIDEQGDANAFPVLLDLRQAGEVHLDQHRDDHHPDEQAYGQVHLGDFHVADGLKDLGQHLAQHDADHDAQKDPNSQVALEDAHGRRVGFERCHGGNVGVHGRCPQLRAMSLRAASKAS